MGAVQQSKGGREGRWGCRRRLGGGGRRELLRRASSGIRLLQGEGNVLWSESGDVKAVMWVNGAIFGGQIDMWEMSIDIKVSAQALWLTHSLSAFRPFSTNIGGTLASCGTLGLFFFSFLFFFFFFYLHTATEEDECVFRLPSRQQLLRFSKTVCGGKQHPSDIKQHPSMI